MDKTSLFLDFMGDSPMMRVLDYLMTEKDLDFSITDIAENSGVGRATLYRIWDNLTENEIIIPTRQIGKAKLFKLNTKNKKVQKLIELDNMLTLEELKVKAGKREVEYDVDMD
ncbi:MAG TPA: helix-turn-helix domain-containing protein [Candidatus Nanoarchaeia archaeon]|nr:helix-turn-helix domain-containing protein [Candidatus Nanoarchaeia archaeon]